MKRSVLRARTEHGSATVYALVMSAVVTMLAVVALQVTMFIVLKHRVSAAADLTALAASKAAASGQDGCDAAKELAKRADVRIASCRMDHEVATVTATARAENWWAVRVRAEITSRAAPIEYVQ